MGRVCSVWSDESRGSHTGTEGETRKRVRDETPWTEEVEGRSEGAKSLQSTLRRQTLPFKDRPKFRHRREGRGTDQIGERKETGMWDPKL